MKTTVELPDELLREAKELAHEQGVTLKELLSSGLRAELDRRATPSPRTDFVFVTFGGDGKGLLPGIDPSMFREIGNERDWVRRMIEERESGQDAS